MISILAFFVLILACLNVLRWGFMFVSAWVLNGKLTLSNDDTWLIALSIAYIVTYFVKII